MTPPWLVGISLMVALHHAPPGRGHEAVRLAVVAGLAIIPTITISHRPDADDAWFAASRAAAVTEVVYGVVAFVRHRPVR